MVKKTIVHNLNTILLLVDYKHNAIIGVILGVLLLIDKKLLKTKFSNAANE